jgi:predicted transcriptional regulator
MLKLKEQEKTYTINEIMEASGYTRRTIMSHIKQRKLLAYKIGNQWKVTEIHYKKYLSTLKTKKCKGSTDNACER